MEASLIVSLSLVEMPIFARRPEVRSHSNHKVKNLFMLSVYLVMDAREKFGEHEKCVRVARGVAVSNCGFFECSPNFPSASIIR